jgi:hypothetical protein
MTTPNPGNTFDFPERRSVVARTWFFSFHNQPRSGIAGKPNRTWRGEARNERGFIITPHRFTGSVACGDSVSSYASSGCFFRFLLSGSSLIFAGILEFWLLGGVADFSLSLFRFCSLGFVGLIDFPLEDRVKRVTFNGKAVPMSRVLLLRNFLRRSLRL